MRMKALVHLVSSPRSDHFKSIWVYGKVQEEVESERARKWVLNIFFIFNSHSPWEYDWVDFFAVFVSCLFHIKVKRLNPSVSRIFFSFYLVHYEMQLQLILILSVHSHFDTCYTFFGRFNHNPQQSQTLLIDRDFNRKLDGSMRVQKTLLWCNRMQQNANNEIIYW